MKLRRGLARIAIVLALPWTTFWGWSFGASALRFNHWNAEVRSNELMLADMRQMNGRGIRVGGGGSGHGVLGMDRSSNSQVLEGQATHLAQLRSYAGDARQQRNRAAWLLILGPLAFIFVVSLGFWVARGFWPRSSE